MADIFLSYNREDRPRALQVAEALGQEGLSVWWDSDLRAGENYDEVTESNLRGAGVVVVLWSKRSVQSKWVRAEATIGQRKSSLMPAMIEECDRPLLFELIQTADLIKWDGDRNDAEWRQFITHIKARVKNAAAAAAAAAQPAAPTPAPQAPQPVQPAQPRRAADTEKSKQIEAATALHAATVETTFWQSIKDGSNVSEYEAYLSRYPNGHFTEIARNRIAMYRAAAKPAAKAPPAETHKPAPKPPVSDAPRPQIKQPTPQARPAPPPPPPRPTAPVSIVERRKSGGMALPLIIVFVLLLAGGGGAYYFLGKPASTSKLAEAGNTVPKEATSTSLRGSRRRPPRMLPKHRHRKSSSCRQRPPRLPPPRRRARLRSRRPRHLPRRRLRPRRTRRHRVRPTPSRTARRARK